MGWVVYGVYNVLLEKSSPDRTMIPVSGVVVRTNMAGGVARVARLVEETEPSGGLIPLLSNESFSVWRQVERYEANTGSSKILRALRLLPLVIVLPSLRLIVVVFSLRVELRVVEFVLEGFAATVDIFASAVSLFLGVIKLVLCESRLQSDKVRPDSKTSLRTVTFRPLGMFTRSFKGSICCACGWVGGCLVVVYAPLSLSRSRSRSRSLSLVANLSRSWRSASAYSKSCISTSLICLKGRKGLPSLVGSGAGAGVTLRGQCNSQRRLTHSWRLRTRGLSQRRTSRLPRYSQ